MLWWFFVDRHFVNDGQPQVSMHVWFFISYFNPPPPPPDREVERGINCWMIAAIIFIFLQSKLYSPYAFIVGMLVIIHLSMDTPQLSDWRKWSVIISYRFQDDCQMRNRQGMIFKNKKKKNCVRVKTMLCNTKFFWYINWNPL
jgi:hypothetical protein